MSLIQHRLSLTAVFVGIAACAVLVAGCSSVPKPVEADGSARVPANDASRLQVLQQRVSSDRELLTANNLLRAQVDVLQTKLAEMITIVREALVLPPAVRPQAAPVLLPLPPSIKPFSPSSSSTPFAAADLPAYSYTTNSFGVVIRVSHAFARTEFEPSEQVAQALRASVRGADRIDVRGHTDSNVVNPIDRLIAIERAEKARKWLINNGADASTIRTAHFTAGSFYAENRSAQGRSLNRRVEIDIRNPRLTSDSVASTN